MNKEITQSEAVLFADIDERLYLACPEHSFILDSFLRWKVDQEGDRYTTREDLNAIDGLRILGEFVESESGVTTVVATLAYDIRLR